MVLPAFDEHPAQRATKAARQAASRTGQARAILEPADAEPCALRRSDNG
jgi:hypothetical protein